MINLENLTYNYQAIDRAHLHLIQGIILSKKPKKCLEIGIGTGNCSQVILSSLKYNNQGTLQCVDNWCDWQGEEPPIAKVLKSLGASIEIAHESDFVQKNKEEKFDFILSDGGHGCSQKNAVALYGMLEDGGTLIAHDITNPNFTNLLGYVDEAKKLKLRYEIFNKSSRKDERCERGLLVVNK